MATISGTVKDVNGDFARRVVRAYRRSDGAFAAQVVSDATTGAFSCTALDTSAHYALTLDGDVPEEFDPYWSNVVLAMHMDDVGLTDAKGTAVTLNGNVARSSTQSKFGGYSAAFDGTGDKLLLSASSNFVFGVQDFTIEGWAYVTGGGAYGRLVHFGPFWQSNDSWGINGNDGSYPNKLTFGSYKLGASRPCVSTNNRPTNQWFHFALTRASGVFRLFMNGVLEATNSSYTSATIESSATNTLAVGSSTTTSGGEDIAGYVDDLRITKGVARYTANFTPPAAAFPHGLSIGAPTTNALIFDNITPV